MSFILFEMQPDLIYPSFAKINLTLRVLGKRDDGFHEIFTVFQSIGLCDEIGFSVSRKTKLVCDNQGIPTDEKNLIVKALNLLANRYRVGKGLTVDLQKRIPFPGGLGGGSSNAAVALIAARKLWNLDISRNELEVFGSEIGADVPFFFRGGTAIGTGRGTQLETLPEFEHGHILIAAADAKIDTGGAFKSLGLGDLTKNWPKSILKNYRDEAQALYSGRFEFQNDFESTVFSAYPEVGKTADILKKSEANAVFLSGSGPSVVGLFESPEALRHASDLVSKDGSVVCFETHTVSGLDYAARFGL